MSWARAVQQLMKAGAAVQETLADELEEAYRSGVWLKERGRLGTHNGLTAARVDLLTPINEHKVGLPSGCVSI